MPDYRIRYISCHQSALSVSREAVVRAESLEEALAQRSAWPMEKDRSGTCAWARNPGTSLYFVEAWEAELTPASGPA